MLQQSSVRITLGYFWYTHCVVVLLLTVSFPSVMLGNFCLCTEFRLSLNGRQQLGLVSVSGAFPVNSRLRPKLTLRLKWTSAFCGFQNQNLLLFLFYMQLSCIQPENKTIYDIVRKCVYCIYLYKICNITMKVC